MRDDQHPLFHNQVNETTNNIVKGMQEVPDSANLLCFSSSLSPSLIDAANFSLSPFQTPTDIDGVVSQRHFHTMI